MPSGEQAGFSLAELLIVLAIVALLSALALPELGAWQRAQAEAAAAADQKVLDRAAANFAWERGGYDAAPEALVQAAYLQRGVSPPLPTKGDGDAR